MKNEGPIYRWTAVVHGLLYTFTHISYFILLLKNNMFHGLSFRMSILLSISSNS